MSRSVLTIHVTELDKRDSLQGGRDLTSKSPYKAEFNHSLAMMSMTVAMSASSTLPSVFTSPFFPPGER